MEEVEVEEEIEGDVEEMEREVEVEGELRVILDYLS